MELTIATAKELLALCDRWESRDHYFGDREVGWTFGDIEVASGYFGGGHRSIVITEAKADGAVLATFADDDAAELVNVGRNVKIGRNDMQGDEYPFERYRGT